jgi:5-methylcytosine-specific restriction endonuclease McrA
MPYKDPQKQKEAQHAWYEKQDKAKKVEFNRKERMKRRRIVNARKKEGCTRCGYNKSTAALVFHHLHDKSFAISQGINDCRSIASIEAEMDKCEIVCANCHAEEHATTNI